MQSRVVGMSGRTTVVERVRHWTRADPGREAFVFRGPGDWRCCLTRAAYLRLATAFAARLQSLGLRPGDVICNFLQNSPERAVTDLGAMLMGAVPMNGAPLLVDGADVRGCLLKGGAKALLVDPGQKDGAWDVCQSILPDCKEGPGHTPELPDLRHVLCCRRDSQGRVLLFEELESSTHQFHEATVKPDDVAYVFTTSGSTGFPKLVTHTHASLEVSLQLLQTLAPLEEGVRLWCDSSLGWMGGFPSWFLTYGCTRVLSDKRAGTPQDMPAFVWNSLVQEHCKNAVLFGGMIDQLRRRPDLWKGSSFILDRVMTGGQPVSRDCLKSLVAAGGFARRFLSWYGATELGKVSSAVYTEDSQFLEFLTGRASPHATVRVVDSCLRDVPAGTRGEILARTEVPFAGYLGDREASAKAFTDDGWFRTNDLGFLDDQGRLFVLGRQGDVIMRGPFIVFPQWLEARVQGCPRVKDVVVVPVCDEVLYNQVCACVVREYGCDVTEADLDRHCDTLFLSGSSSEQTPRPKYFLFFDDLPRTLTGKIDRKELAKLAAGRLRNGSD